MNQTEEVYKFNTRQEYLAALDTVMPDAYISNRSIGGSQQHKYIAQGIKEAIADDIFFNWNVIDEDYNIVANEIMCTVKLQFQPNYPGADEQFCTGTASTPIQMDANSTIKDFPAKKKKNALEYNAPSVRSEAIGNAFGTLGNIFGRNLNRQDLTNDFAIRKTDEKAPASKSK